MDVDRALEIAVQHQDAGRLDDAETLYLQILESEREPYALYFLGLIEQKRGRHERALALLHEAIELDAECGEFWHGLGGTLHALGRSADASEAYRRAIDLDPELADLYLRRGNTLALAGRFSEAEAAYRSQIELTPQNAQAYNNLGSALQDQGKVAEAAAAYSRAMEIDPAFAEAQNNLGLTLHAQGKFAEAEAVHRKTIQLSPQFAQAHANLGTCLFAQGKISESMAANSEALSLNPALAEAHHNMGLALYAQGKLDEAAAAYGRAIHFKSDFAEAYANLGTCLYFQKKIPESTAAYSQSLQFAPQLAKAHLSLGLTHLLLGEFERGWRMYEWRWKCKEAGLATRFPQPQWDGRELSGKTILLHAEQGFGDTIQFVRYVPMVAARGGRVLLECPPELTRLVRHVPGIARVIARGDPVPPFDTHCPLMSLPLAFATHIDTIPATVPYLFAEPAQQKVWAAKLGNTSKQMQVGLSWAGRPTHVNDRNRSIPLAQFAPLAAATGMRLVSLQKGETTDQLARVPALGLRNLGDFGDFTDTAALISQLDLVITVDSAVAHLAGAMGRPVWVLVPFAPDWRWMLDRDDSPWYPTMRLFRQAAMGDWAGVVERVAKSLAALRREPALS